MTETITAAIALAVYILAAMLGIFPRTIRDDDGTLVHSNERVEP